MHQIKILDEIHLTTNQRCEHTFSRSLETSSIVRNIQFNALFDTVSNEVISIQWYYEGLEVESIFSIDVNINIRKNE